jgi:hypothetical protein
VFRVGGSPLSRLREVLARHSTLVHALVAVGLFAWALGLFNAARAGVELQGDESSSISMSSYFRTLFLERNTRPGAWSPGYYTLTQPPGFRHVLGAGLWLQGHDLATLNEPFDWRYPNDLEWQRQHGRLPTDEILRDARTVAILFGAGAVALLYVVAVQLDLPIGGIAAALTVSANPYIQLHFGRAKAESTFAFFLLLSVVLVLRSFGRPAGGPRLWDAVPAGLALGLALSTKLTGILSIPALGLACLLAILSRRPGSRLRGLSVRPLGWGCVAVAVCCALFVALNPFLWRDPLGRTYALFEFRRVEMIGQQQSYPDDAVYDLDDRVTRVLRRALVDDTWATTALGVPLDVPLAAIGLITLGIMAASDWRRTRHVGPASVFVLWLHAYLFGTIWGYSLDWERYVLPVYLFAALTSGIGLSVLLQHALELRVARATGGHNPWLTAETCARTFDTLPRVARAAMIKQVERDEEIGYGRTSGGVGAAARAGERRAHRGG